MLNTVEISQIHADLQTISYSRDLPECILEAARTPEMRRLSDVGMSCGCEYTDNGAL